MQKYVFFTSYVTIVHVHKNVTSTPGFNEYTMLQMGLTLLTILPERCISYFLEECIILYVLLCACFVLMTKVRRTNVAGKDWIKVSRRLRVS